MNTNALKSLIFVFAVALCACEHNDFPSGPVEDIHLYDTVDCTGMNIPANAITVQEALKIGKTLNSGQASTQMYYIKGLVKSFHPDKHATGIAKEHKAYFYMQDSKMANIDFYAYQIKGLNGGDFNAEDIEIGDFVVVCCKLYNYNGTIETDGKSSPFLYYTTNDNPYPIKFEPVYTADFSNGLGDWETVVKSDPGVNVWKTVKDGEDYAVVAQAVSPEGARLAGETWLVSPVFNIPAMKLQSPKLEFENHYIKNIEQGVATDIHEQLLLKVSSDGVNWTDIDIPNFNGGTIPGYKANTIDISAYASANMRVAFVYKSTAQSAPKWTIKSISIGGDKHSRK
ncbi:MAG: choice-of-anchor J domain-containing protein [Paludibacteraceae bacterium]|nr:choice-of-anchor J domain-containing protein [Paludibacteraceae bacterium]